MREAPPERLRSVMVFVMSCRLVVENVIVSFIAVRISLGVDGTIRPSEAENTVLRSE